MQGWRCLAARSSPAPAAWGEAATLPVLLGVSSAACGTEELPGFGKPHRISAPGRFLCLANLAAPCPAEPAVALPRAGPAAQQRTSCSLGPLIGTAHSAQEGNIGQPTRILPRRLGHRRLPETPAAAPRLLGGEEKRIAFVRGRKKILKNKKPTKTPERPGGSERAMRNVRAQGMVFAAGAAITPGSAALSLPTRCPAEHVPQSCRRGEILSAPRQPRRARLLRRAAQSSGPSGVPAERGMRPWQPGRIPQQGPVYQRRQPARDSASSAALPLPPGTRESPPRQPRRRHAQRDAPAKCGGKRGARENGSSGRWESPRAGNSPSDISDSASGGVCGAGKAGLRLCHEVGSSRSRLQ